jgi:hypothetical protein
VEHPAGSILKEIVKGLAADIEGPVRGVPDLFKGPSVHTV